MSVMRSEGVRAGVVGLLAALVLTACGGGGGDDRTEDDSAVASPGIPSATVTAMATATPTEAPTTTPTATVEPDVTPVVAFETWEAMATAVPTQPVIVGAASTPSPAATRAPAPSPTRAPAASTGSGVTSLALASARVSGDPVEVRDTVWRGGHEYFADPSAPQYISWYERFGRPGSAGTNSIFAAHINYVGHGNGPFAFLTSATVGDVLHVTMANGTTYSYSVQSVRVIPLSQLDMNQVVYPALGEGRERVTLISCGGTFVPRRGGVGGDYDSRVVLVAERIV